MPFSSSIIPPKHSTNQPKRKELPRTQQQVDERPKHWNDQPLKLVDSASEGNGRRPSNEIGRSGNVQQAVIGPRGRIGKRPPLQRGTQQKQAQQQNQENSRNWGNGERGRNGNNNNNGQWQQNGQNFVNNQQYGTNWNQQHQQGNIGNNGQWQQQQFGTTNWGGSQSTTFGQFQQQPTSFSNQQFYPPNNGQQQQYWPNQQNQQNWPNQQQNFNQFGGFPVRTLPDPVQSTPPSLVNSFFVFQFYYIFVIPLRFIIHSPVALCSLLANPINNKSSLNSFDLAENK